MWNLIHASDGPGTRKLLSISKLKSNGDERLITVIESLHASYNNRQTWITKSSVHYYKTQFCGKLRIPAFLILSSSERLEVTNSLEQNPPDDTHSASA